MAKLNYNNLLKRVHSATAKERIDDDRFKFQKLMFSMKEIRQF